MQKRIVRSSIRRKIALALTVCMSVGSVGCGQNEAVTAQESAVEPSVPAVSENDISVSEPVIREKIDDQGNPIRDFDEFVNGEWKKEQAEKDQTRTFRYKDAAHELWDGVVDILDNTDVSELSEEDGLYKVCTIYHQIADPTDTEERQASMKAYLAEIEKVRTLDELYDLYRNERYDTWNVLLNFDVIPDDGYYVDLEWLPLDPWEGDWDPVLSGTGNGILLWHVMDTLGYSSDEIQRITENAVTVAQKIDEYYNNTMESNYRFVGKDELEEAGVKVPVIDILGDQYAQFCPEAFNPRWDGFWAPDDVYLFLQELYVPENLQMIKDFHVACAVKYMMPVVDMQRCILYQGDPALNTDQVAAQIVSIYAEELLAQEYIKRNVDGRTIEQCESIMEEVKQSTRTIIDDADWLSLHGKEQARSKVLRIQEYFTGDTAVNDFSDLILTENTFENYISMCVSTDRYLKSQYTTSRDAREIFTTSDLEVNAFYMTRYNAMVCTPGWLQYVQDAGADSEEALLGIIGTTLAHELGHAYDPNGSMYNSRGEYEPWMSEEERALYDEKAQQIADFLDGWETEYGLTIDGELVVNETYADLMAVECCLRILAEKEDPDYDAFFCAYAEDRAAYYTEEELEKALIDTHLPGKERINLVLGQFDQFYETYDIDENSPYYVKEADRLSVF